MRIRAIIMSNKITLLRKLFSSTENL